MDRGPVVAVTGASAGVGRAVALAFAGLGARVGLIARDRGALEAVRTEVERIGGRGIVLPADVAEADAVFAAADRIERELGPLDVWVNSAMATVYGMSWDITPEELRRVTEVTYLGGAYGVQAALRHMRPRDRGAVLQVGSALAYRSIPAQAAYCAAKAAIRGYVDSVRVELLREGSAVTVTSVHLPAVNTPQFDWARCHLPNRPRPVAPVFQPEDIAREIVAAARSPRREYWIGRATRLAILGTFAAPGIADRYLASRGVEGQQTAEPLEPGQRDNLFETVPGLHRTRGRFSGEAEASPLSLGEGVVRGVLALAGVSVLAAGAWALSSRARR
jgi:NAD(P)-dependent dehydrogenase (short-subunit alcohol dehydrogenase family)